MERLFPDPLRRPYIGPDGKDTMGEYYLMGYRFCIAVLMILLSAAAFPAGAVVTKDTLGSISDIPGMEIQISPDSVDTCDRHITDLTTFWWQESVLWKRDINEKISGICHEGTSFECHARLVMNAQNSGTSLSVAHGTCWFLYPDGSRFKKVFPWTDATGDWEVDFSKW